MYYSIQIDGTQQIVMVRATGALTRAGGTTTARIPNLAYALGGGGDRCRRALKRSGMRRRSSSTI